MREGERGGGEEGWGRNRVGERGDREGMECGLVRGGERVK